MGKANHKAMRQHVHYHRDGSIWARGQMTSDDVMCGYWEWFRKDGSKMRSGYFEDGEQVGEWTTYDRKGKVVKVTQMKGKPAANSASKEVRKSVKKATTQAAKGRPTKKRTAKKV